MKRSMDDSDGDYYAKRRPVGGTGSINDMRVLLPSQVSAQLDICRLSVFHELCSWLFE